MKITQYKINTPKINRSLNIACVADLHGRKSDAVIEPQERIAQLLVMPYITAAFMECDTLDETARGAGGFGSTGTR